MIISIVSIIANIMFFAVLKMNLYTDKAHMADGTVRTYHRSPISRLYVADKSELLYLYVFFAAVSIITGILVLIGIRNNVIRIVQIIASIGSAVMFIIIMMVTAKIHPHY